MILSIYLKMPLKYVCIKMSFFVISIDAPKLVQNLPSPESISNQKNVPNESQKKNIKIKSQIIRKPQNQNEERESNLSLSDQIGHPLSESQPTAHNSFLLLNVSILNFSKTFPVFINSNLIVFLHCFRYQILWSVEFLVILGFGVAGFGFIATVMAICALKFWICGYFFVLNRFFVVL